MILNSDLEMLNNVLYIKGIPTFLFMPNGERDFIASDGLTIYFENKEFIDKWLLKKRKI